MQKGMRNEWGRFNSRIFQGFNPLKSKYFLMGNFSTFKITDYKIIWILCYHFTYWLFTCRERAVRTINKTIRKSKLEFKGGDGELGWKSKLLEGQIYKSFVEWYKLIMASQKHSKLEVLNPQVRNKGIQILQKYGSAK